MTGGRSGFDGPLTGQSWDMPPFADRADAGRRLAPLVADALRVPGGDGTPIVLALPRGGVPVAFEIGAALGLELDLLLVRKLGVPGREELAFGAIASGGVQVLNPEIVATADVRPEALEAIVERELAELHRRERRYRGDRPPAAVAGRTVVVVDDGLATGATMRAAVAALRERGAARIVVAVPVGSGDACAQLDVEADALICPVLPRRFRAVGAWFDDFEPVGDAQVAELLARAAAAART
ncbi:MAG TPA: phosphoribosyltransferase family protein [Baekduia sp.]|uniref:phosphoribosyltransferase n=1 Tax=Baekduia sp. TaxID=2600305 RepID=UPI002BA79C5C|nr:phosphoribosyltransferase family protein [Baekduia sp.]HMJ37618.1 phosphoribosyltransferase family protein [Baekduia sp.]